MGKKHQESRHEGLPRELARSTPRAVLLSPAGRAAVAGVIALLAGAPFAGVWLYSRVATQIVAEVVATEAQVTEISRPRGENPRARVSYRYTVAGREYSGRTRIGKREDNRFVVGSIVAVEYDPSKPEKAWIHGYRPRPVPLWVVITLPAVLVPGVIPIVMALLRQRRLLACGKAALARVTDTRLLPYREHKVWRVQYEWTLLNGAIRKGHYDRAKNPPSPGTIIPVLYDPDNPRRHRPYPLSLVRL
jgi:hypothetical protein